MANGLLQGKSGDILNKARSGGTVADALEAIERIAVLLDNPIVLNEQLQITCSVRTGPAIQITSDSNATAQAIGIQIKQGGPFAILGVGLKSIGIFASSLLNKDTHQPQSSAAIQSLMANAPGNNGADAGTGFVAKGIATGKPSSDVGTMTAGPGELMPNAQISGWQKVATNNLVMEGVLISTLSAATSGMSGATTATLQSWKVDPLGSGNMVNGPVLTLTNRDKNLSGSIGSYVQARWISSELRPQSVSASATDSCPGFSAVPAQWTVPAIAGITGASGTNPCVGCSTVYNSQQTMTFVASSNPCSWKTAANINCPVVGTLSVWYMNMTTSQVILEACGNNGSSIALWGYSIPPGFSPFAPITLSLSVNGGGCITWPHSITVTPA